MSSYTSQKTWWWL